MVWLKPLCSPNVNRICWISKKHHDSILQMRQERYCCWVGNYIGLTIGFWQKITANRLRVSCQEIICTNLPNRGATKKFSPLLCWKTVHVVIGCSSLAYSLTQDMHGHASYRTNTNQHKPTMLSQTVGLGRQDRAVGVSGLLAAAICWDIGWCLFSMGSVQYMLDDCSTF